MDTYDRSDLQAQIFRTDPIGVEGAKKVQKRELLVIWTPDGQIYDATENLSAYAGVIRRSVEPKVIVKEWKRLRDEGRRARKQRDKGES